MVDVENELFRVHNPLDITDKATTPVLLAALGPAMLKLAGERTDGTRTARMTPMSRRPLISMTSR